MDIRHGNGVYLAARAVLAAGMLMMALGVAAENEPHDRSNTGITGSHLDSTAIAGMLPLYVIDRDTIEQSGHSSVADLMRGTTFNSAGSFRPQSGSSAQSFAGIGLRALGEGRTLVLVDGKRAPIAPNVGSAQDLNAIPLAMVERIEILPQGASAIYGSDAIGGVVNIITRRDFTGAEVMVGASDPSREGGDTAEFSALLGIAGDRGRVMMGVGRNHRDIVFSRDRSWSDERFAIFSNNFVELDFSFYDNAIHGPAVPGNGCTGDAFSTTSTGLTGLLCRYEISQVSADEAEHGNTSLFVHGSYEINANWTYHFDSRVSRVESFGRFAPAPSHPWPGVAPLLEAGTPNHPATSPVDGGLNPFWADYQDVATEDLRLLHRFAGVGPRDTVTDSNDYLLDTGVSGSIGDFDIDFGVRSVESKYFDLGRNYIVPEIAQDLIADGTYSIYDPLAVSDDVANSISVTINREAQYHSREVYLNTTTQLFDMPAGTVQFAFGGDYREIDYEDRYDSLSEGGQVAGAAGNSAAGGRYVKSFHVETMLPLLDDFDMNVAARYDGYSDFGNEISPRIALSYRLFDGLKFRTNWGQGFDAPSLDIIGQQPAFSIQNVIHAPIGINPPPNPHQAIPTYQVANPDIEAEHSTHLGFGIDFQPANWLSGSVDYHRIEVEDQVTFIGAQQVVSCLIGAISNCPNELSILDENLDPPVPGAGLGAAFQNNEPSLPLIFIQTGYANMGRIETDALDIRLEARFDIGAGVLSHELMLTRMLGYTVDGGEDLAGDIGLPEMRATLRNHYALGDFGISWNINHIGAQDGGPGSLDDVDSWLTHDLQFSYMTAWDGQVAIGMINATDEDPPLDGFESRGFNFNLFDGYGRMPYLRYTQQF